MRRYFYTFKKPRNRFQVINSASPAGRYDNPIPIRFLAPIDRSKSSALGVLFLYKCAPIKKRKKYVLLYCNLGEVIRSRCSMFHIELSLLLLPVPCSGSYTALIVKKAICFFICFSWYNYCVKLLCHEIKFIFWSRMDSSLYRSR
jgi:hypothetical protein